MHEFRVSLRLGRLGEAVLDDPTRNLQLACGFFVFLLGVNLFSAPILLPRATAQVVFGFLDRETWGGFRIAFGLAQMVASTFSRTRWRWKFFIAQVHVFLAVFAYVATTITTDEPTLATAQLWLVAVEIWIGSRALWDRDINGTDRRLHG